MNPVYLLPIGPFSLLLFAVLLRLIAATVSDGSSTGWKRTLLVRISLCLSLISIFGMMALIYFVPAAGVIGLFLSFGFLVMTSEAELRYAGVRRRAQQAELLWVLAIAARTERPLADEIEAYASGTWGKRRRQLFDMAYRLRDGVSLTELVVPQGLLPSSAKMQIHSGITSKSLLDSLAQTADRVTRELADDQELDFPGAALAYPPALLMVTSIVIGFVMYYIIPKFKKIFEDFNTELPRMTVSLINLSDITVNYWFAVALPVFVYFPLGICIIVGFAEYYGWQNLLQSELGRWFVRWHTPDVMRALSQSLSQRVPIDQALASIMRFAGPVRLRKQLGRALDAIEDGTDSWQALERSGLLAPSETVVLELAQRTDNLPWALATLATNLEQRRTFRLRAILEVVQPAMLIPIGIMVGFVCVSLFMPLVKLLSDLS